jgi:hypothetical protein
MKILILLVLSLSYVSSFTSSGHRYIQKSSKNRASNKYSGNFRLFVKAPEKIEEKKGLESKYLVALGVFAFAALFDFFVVHQGQPYLAHPM